VVPDAVALNVNFRFAPGNTAEAAEAELRALVGGDGDVEVVDAAPSGRRARGPSAHRRLDRGRGPAGDAEAGVDGRGAFTTHGIPAVNFGPGETAQAHQANEWCSIEALELCYGALSRFFRA
jgi:succinyl-diaminopimelate desuccinylase